MRFRVKNYLKDHYPKDRLENNLALILSSLIWLAESIASDYELESLKLDIFHECYLGFSYAYRRRSDFVWDIALHRGERFALKEKSSWNIDLERLPIEFEGYLPDYVRYHRARCSFWEL